MSKEYIPKKLTDKFNNYELLVFATEHYVQFMYFLEELRGYKNFKIKIGHFKYDDWEADIYCILNEKGVFFKHIRRDDKKEWINKSLTESFIYAWGFKETNFNITFDILNKFWKLLNEEEKDYYDSLYDEAHGYYW